LLSGKSVIVTGAGRGLGQAYAIAMAAEGASVVVNDIDVVEAERTVSIINENGGTAITNGDSVAEWTAAKRIVDLCVRSFGAVDVLVNNAALFYGASIWETSERDFDTLVSVNLKGAFNMAHHALEHMVPHKSGCIINTTSGAQVGMERCSIYAATKAGIAGFTYSWALELATHNVRVNAVSPGATTRMTQTTRQMGHPTEGASPPETNAPLVVFLASADAMHVTGQVLQLSGTTLRIYAPPAAHYSSDRVNGWAVDDLQKDFHRTMSAYFQPIGMKAKRYQYPKGLIERS
jgi:NAD(P)-dependent dehydrogenase (short-subunit alcohol dehydrogenase family)